MVHLLRNTLTKSQHVKHDKHEQHAESAPKRTYWNGPMIWQWCRSLHPSGAAGNWQDMVTSWDLPRPKILWYCKIDRRAWKLSTAVTAICCVVGSRWILFFNKRTWRQLASTRKPNAHKCASQGYRKYSKYFQMIHKYLKCIKMLKMQLDVKTGDDLSKLRWSKRICVIPMVCVCVWMGF